MRLAGTGHLERRISFGLLVAATLLVAWPMTGAAAWKEKTVKGGALLNQCSSMHETEVVEASEGDYRGAKVFSNKGATLTFCYYDEPKKGFTDHQYLVKYSAPKEKAFTELHSDAEMMAWGAEIKTKKDVLTFTLKWGEKQDSRRVREFTIDCKKKCTLTEKCEVEKLKSDVKAKDLFSFIKDKAKTDKSRSEFVLSEKSSDVRRMNQLFVEALTGNSEAEALLKKFEEGSDAAWGEVIGTFTMYVDDLKSKNCKWK
ncbi:MAG: hypothetical protein ABL958_13600 [Bdellovibrionia bacterium]